jgi:hypothetical protein
MISAVSLMMRENLQGRSLHDLALKVNSLKRLGHVNGAPAGNLDILAHTSLTPQAQQAVLTVDYIFPSQLRAD